MMKKRAYPLLIALICPVLGGVVSCSSKKTDPSIYQVRIHENDTIKGSPVTDWFKIRFNVEDFVSMGDKPTLELANLALVFAANTSTYEYVEVKNAKNPVTSFGDYSTLYKEFGFSDIEVINDKPFDIDPNDYSGCVFAHQEFDYLEKDYDLVFINYIESNGSKNWISNFDVGADTPDYYEETGEHPDWINKDTHKGFDVAANRIYSDTKQYLNNLDSQKEKIIFMYGHSRGAAMSNILGKNLIDEGYNVHSYCFATPNVSTVIKKDYKTIYNFLNESDIITFVPSEVWGFKKYGLVYSGDATKYQNEFRTFNNYALGDIDISGFKLIFDRIASDRDTMYKIDKKYLLASKVCADEAAADKEISRYESAFTGKLESLNKFVKTAKEVQDNGEIITYFYTCPGLLTGLISIALNIWNTQLILETFLPVIAYLKSFMDSLATEVDIDISSVMSSFSSIYVAHIFSSYYIVLNHGINFD